MTLIALVISLFISALGALGLVFPSKWLAFARFFDSRSGLWMSTALRLVFGMAIYQSAPTSLTPEILHVVGIAIIAAGIATPLVGAKRIHQILNWWEARGPLFIRIWAGSALIAGLLLVSAIVT